MQVCGASQWADFAVAEAAGHRELRKHVSSDVHITIGTAEQTVTPAQAGEQHSHQWCGVAALITSLLEQLARFHARGLRFTQLELNVLPSTDAIGHSDRAIAGIDADQIAHQESPFGAIAACTDLIQARQHCIGNQLLPFHTQEQ